MAKHVADRRIWRLLAHLFGAWKTGPMGAQFVGGHGLSLRHRAKIDEVVDQATQNGRHRRLDDRRTPVEIRRANLLAEGQGGSSGQSPRLFCTRPSSETSRAPHSTGKTRWIPRSQAKSRMANAVSKLRCPGSTTARITSAAQACHGSNAQVQPRCRAAPHRSDPPTTVPRTRFKTAFSAQ